jgi:hypothetical protein
MTVDSSGLTDEVAAELNPASPEPDNGPQPDPIPKRPADGAAVDKWVEYVVALGADRTFVTEATCHQDGPNDYEVVPALKRAELIELADRLGG